jgi:UDP-N-acetylglucosamine 2-epimerase (non-hydrolysing)
MPEELNRLATDAVCDYAFTSEPSGIEHLLREGWPESRIKFVGNTMIDSQHYARERAVMSPIMRELQLLDGEYVLVTLHRPSNVDEPEQLKSLLLALGELSKTRTVVLPAHPRTLARIEQFGLQNILDSHAELKIIGPQGYVRFLRLVMGADFVITDSGGLQEETTALGLPCLTVRTTTERPITCELGTNQLIEPNGASLLAAAESILSGNRKKGSVPLFWDGRTGQRIARRVLSILYPEMNIGHSSAGQGA